MVVSWKRKIQTEHRTSIVQIQVDYQIKEFHIMTIILKYKKFFYHRLTSETSVYLTTQLTFTTG